MLCSSFRIENEISKSCSSCLQHCIHACCCLPQWRTGSQESADEWISRTEKVVLSPSFCLRSNNGHVLPHGLLNGFRLRFTYNTFRTWFSMDLRRARSLLEGGRAQLVCETLSALGPQRGADGLSEADLDGKGRRVRSSYPTSKLESDGGLRIEDVRC